MTDDDAFLRAIQAAPNDAAPKLVYADWLDENGQPLRAEYLRLWAEAIQYQCYPVYYHRALARSYELAEAIPVEWRCRTCTFRWDAFTHLQVTVLARLLRLIALFNDPATGDVVYNTHCDLLAKYIPVPDLVREMRLFGSHEARLLPMEDLARDVREQLHRWLFANYPEAPDGDPHLRITTQEGREDMVFEILGVIDGLIQPHMDISPNLSVAARRQMPCR